MTRRPTKAAIADKALKKVALADVSGRYSGVKVKDDDTPVEVLAASIVDISAAAKSLLSSRLRYDTLVLLISHSSKVPQKHVKAVLESIRDLEKRYLK